MFHLPVKNRKGASNHFSRRLQFESLEERRLLTVYTVTEDEDDGSRDPGTLSWAINLVNTNPGGLHEIHFSVSGNTINVSGTLPPITHAATTIDGESSNVHIRRVNNATVFNGLTYNGNSEGAGWFQILNVEISN